VCACVCVCVSVCVCVCVCGTTHPQGRDDGLDVVDDQLSHKRHQDCRAEKNPNRLELGPHGAVLQVMATLAFLVVVNRWLVDVVDVRSQRVPCVALLRGRVCVCVNIELTKVTK
jgi:hypothetical protein